MKKVLQITRKCSSVDEVEDALAACLAIQSCLVAFATHGRKLNPQEPDTVVSLYHCNFREGETLFKGARYTWLDDTTYSRLMIECNARAAAVQRFKVGA